MQQKTLRKEKGGFRIEHDSFTCTRNIEVETSVF